MFSILIPTFNNLQYLKLCIESILKNSKYKHEIILHVNEGTDGTLDYVKNNGLKYSFTPYNSGICEGINKASKMSQKEYILYAHDDFYFCPDWDLNMMNEVNSLNTNLFYLSGTMIQNGQVELDCGYDLQTFNEKKLLDNFNSIQYYDFQGSTWAPHLIHKKLWDKVGGLSEEFFPGTGSDPDLNMKLWKEGVRVFKGLSKSKVYHFGSIVTRKYKSSSTITESGSKGGKIFLQKWGVSIKFFTRFYLNGCKTKNGKIYCNKYYGPLEEPKKNVSYYANLFMCKINLIYLKIVSFFK